MIERNRDESSPPVMGGRPVNEASGPRVDIIASIWRHIWVLFFFELMAVGGSMFFLSKSEKIYSSSATIYVERWGPTVMNKVEGVMMSDPSYLITQTELMRSTSVLIDATRHLPTNEMQMFKDEIDPVTAIRRNLTVAVETGGLLSVTIRSRFPQEAPAIANEIVGAYMRFHDERKRSTGDEVINILRKEKAKQDDLLSHKIAGMLAFQKEHPDLTLITSTDASGNVSTHVATESMDRLRVSVADAQAASEEAERTYEAFKRKAEDPQKRAELSIDVAYDSEHENPMLARLLQEISDKESEQFELKILASEKHPNVLRLDKTLVALRASAQQWEDRLISARLAKLKEDAEMAHGRLEDMKAAFAVERQQILAIGEQEAGYTMLEADYRQTWKMVEMLDSRIKELDVDQNTGAMNISIVEVARPSLDPEWPNPQKVILTSILLGFISGIAVIMLWEMVDPRIRTPEELADILNAPIFGLVPTMAGPKKEYGQYCNAFPRSPVAEAFRSIRTMALMTLSRRKVRLILITSGIPSDGKSTVVSNLGIALAQANFRTLIVDSDLRKSTQHKIFAVDNSKGFSNVLQGNISLAEGVVPTTTPNLSIIPAGPPPTNPAELLNGEILRRVLAELSSSQDFDCVLMDSPPIVPIADARILASICDITLLVVRLNHTPRKVALSTLEILASVGARVNGAIVSGLNTGRGYYGYKAYYYNYNSLDS